MASNIPWLRISKYSLTHVTGHDYQNQLLFENVFIFI